MDKIFSGFNSKEAGANIASRKNKKKQEEELKKKEAELIQKLKDIKDRQEKFTQEFKNFETRKKEADPLFQFWRNKPEAANVKPEEIGQDYRAVEEVVDEKNPEKKNYRHHIFNNYHDFLDFQKNLAPEQRDRLINSQWVTNKGKENEEKWTSPAVYAYKNFNDRWTKEDGDLHKYAGEYRALREQARMEKIKDDFNETKEEVDKEYNDFIGQLNAEEKETGEELHWLGREDERKKFEEEEKELEKKRQEQEIFKNTGDISREHLENIRIKEGKIEKPQFKDFEYAKKNLNKELNGLVSALLAEESKETDKDFEKTLAKIAKKTNLPLEEIKEIYVQNQESVIVEAKAEINKSASVKAKIAKTLVKSGLYIGAGVLAGTSTAATLGLGGIVGASAIAGARILDRVITEKMDRKKLEAKVAEVKKRKGEEERKAMQDRLAAAISLKKKLEIERVDLSGKGAEAGIDRESVINKYIEEQAKAGILEVEPEKLEDYKKKMVSVLVGLDDMDRFNAQKEAEINNPAWFDKLKKFEDKLTGDTPEKKTVSSAAIIAAGLAARELPGIRNVLMGYAGWKLGGALFDNLLKKERKGFHEYMDKELASGILNKNGHANRQNYSYAVRKLADGNFKKNQPGEYLKLQQEVEEVKIQLLNSSIDEAKNLNDRLEFDLENEKKRKKSDNAIRFFGRLGGATLGVLTGQLIQNLSDSRIYQAENAELLKETIPAKEVVPPEAVVPTELVQQPGEAGDAPVFQPADSVSFTPDSNAVDLSNLRVDNTKIFEQAEPFSPDTASVWKPWKVEDVLDSQQADTAKVVPLAPDNLPIVETGSGEAGEDIFEDTISNVGLKPGQHDSVWRSAEQIFKNNAQKLGYQGDLDNQEALKHWAEAETAKALNNSGDITDKVFEGNRVILERGDDGDFQVRIDKAQGYQPGFLKQETDSRGIQNMQEIEPKEVVDSGAEDTTITDAENKITESKFISEEADKRMAAERFLKESAGSSSVNEITSESNIDEYGQNTPESFSETESQALDTGKSVKDSNGTVESMIAENKMNDATVSGEDETLVSENNLKNNYTEESKEVESELLTTGSEGKFNLNNEAGLKKLFNINSEELFQKLSNSKDLKDLDLEFDSKYSAVEQMKIKNYIAHEILEIQEKQELMNQYQAQYGDRPQFAEFKKIMESGVANSKKSLADLIMNCDDPKRNITVRGEFIWQNKEYSLSAQADIDFAANRANLISLKERLEQQEQELNQELDNM